MQFNLANCVVVFDLDDTLYPEADYVESGMRYVCAQIKNIYGHDIYEYVLNALEQNPKLDWLELVCNRAKLPFAVKESLLWQYRLHLPDISLSNSCKDALKSIRSASNAVTVLTDGRSVTQRLKLKALGLADWPAYISEDYGSTKPDPARFKAVQADYPAQYYIYVADNVQKDFVGCNPLGWISVGMRGNQRNLYSQALQGQPKSALPVHWVNSWQELTSLLFNGKSCLA